MDSGVLEIFGAYTNGRMNEMRNALRISSAFFLLIGLIGCVEIEVNTKVDEQGKGRQRWRFTGTALLSTEIKKQVQNNRFFSKSVIQDQFKDGDYILEATLPFQNISELRNADRDVRFETKGWILKTHTYTEVWKRSGQPLGLLAQHAKGLVPVTLRVAVELPGRIIETNADFQEGSIARWSIPVSDLISTKILAAKSQSWNWMLLIPALILLFLGFTVLAFLLYRTGKNARAPSVPSVDCPACGARVAGGSAFCNFCGNRMNSESAKS
jgi:hypothetical protein